MGNFVMRFHLEGCSLPLAAIVRNGPSPYNTVHLEKSLYKLEERALSTTANLLDDLRH